MDKWEIPNLQTICYIKPNILEVAYLVTGLDQIQSQNPILYGGLKGPATYLARSYLTT